MNTDNCSVAGETIDYGPCAFMDTYHPGRVLSSIDTNGRYAYANQPQIAQWNLARLAETLLPLLAGDGEDAQLASAKEALGAFAGLFEDAYLAGLRAKLGLREARPDDLALAHDLLDRMARAKADMTLVFRRLGDAAADPAADDEVASLFELPVAFTGWVGKWRDRLAAEGGDADARRAAMQAVNPAFIPRNHLVEQAIEAAVRRDDLAPFETLVAVLSRPFEAQPGREAFMQPPRPEEVVQNTFCGT
jgi:uncharacterized protein YdiU (UPF0061 family)